MSQAILLPETGPSGSLQHSGSRSIQFELYSIVWAIATLFHMANHRSYADSLPYFLLTFAALFLLIKPSSVDRLILLLSMQLFEVFLTMPYVSNHWIFTAFVNLTILQAIIYLAIKKRSFVIDKDELLTTFAPVVRIQVLILYFYVVFHKLNSDFFLTDISCASDFFISQNAYSLLPQTQEVLALNAYLTVGVEGLIPLLLCFRKTRDWGILIGLLFHCVIAFNPTNGFYDFSSMIFGAYILFTSRHFSDRVYKLFVALKARQQKAKDQWAQFSVQKLALLMVSAGAGFAVILVLTFTVEDFFRHILWSLFSFTYIAVFLVAMLKRKKAEAVSPQPAFALPAWPFLLFPVLVLLNGLSPYLGLKTENSFAMFSNLRTEGGTTNHFIVPASTQVFDYQKDLVEIVTSTDPKLAQLAKDQKLMVYFTFRNHVSNKKPDYIEYIRNGKHHIFEKENTASHAGLMQANPLWQRKLLNFRNINKNNPQPCSH